jgi:hypothetical protein
MQRNVQHRMQRAAGTARESAGHRQPVVPLGLAPGNWSATHAEHGSTCSHSLRSPLSAHRSDGREPLSPNRRTGCPVLIIGQFGLIEAWALTCSHLTNRTPLSVTTERSCHSSARRHLCLVPAPVGDGKTVVSIYFRIQRIVNLRALLPFTVRHPDTSRTRNAVTHSDEMSRWVAVVPGAAPGGPLTSPG